MRAATMPTVADPIHEARKVTKDARRIQKQLDAVNARRRQIIALLLAHGLTQAEVARQLDISRQRVTQYVDELRAAGVIPPDEDAPADE